MAYLVYRYRRDILVKKGRLTTVFQPEKGPWHTGIPDTFMKVNSKGKILCRTEEEIPVAVDLLREYYKNKLETVQHQNDVSMNNIEAFINSSGYTLIE